MSNRSSYNSPESPTNRHESTSSSSSDIRQLRNTVLSTVVSTIVWSALLIVISGSAVAQSDVGNVYCGTGVETGIGLVFGAVAGLGLPATGFYVGRAGLSYMRAGGNPEKKNRAKEKLVMSGIGFGIIVLALISPELIDKIGSQMGFGFSDCVKPF
ncbi:pilin [Haloterrigena salifodinae]|uniref:pilin n=1 Tax=Haloterrigena salifodinae TaxID=2675099 RepID=UPI001E3B42D7|nr:pilin [Haloterrigena salifodinae]